MSHQLFWSEHTRNNQDAWLTRIHRSVQAVWSVSRFTSSRLRIGPFGVTALGSRFGSGLAVVCTLGRVVWGFGDVSGRGFRVWAPLEILPFIHSDTKPTLKLHTALIL